MTMLTHLKPGALLYRRKGLVQHAGVYLGDAEVLHNSPSAGIAIVSFDRFAAGKKVKVIDRHLEAAPLDYSELRKRAQAIIDGRASYNVLLNNCEHIANRLLRNRNSSPQLRATTAAALTAGLAVGSRSSRARKRYAAGSAALAAVAGCLLSNASRRYDLVIPARAVGAAAPSNADDTLVAPL